MNLRVGYVPEHFSAPFLLAEQSFNKNHLVIESIPCPSGTGSMIEMLNNNEIDIAIGLTEGFTVKICKREAQFKLIGSFVESSLRWAISTGIDRKLESVDQLLGANIGISRYTSGSHIMSLVLAKRQGWSKSLNFKVLDNFENLRNAVNSGEIDAFMWEYFTSKKYYQSREIKQISLLETPWPSWVIAARTTKVDGSILACSKSLIVKFLDCLNLGIALFCSNRENAASFIAENLPYSQTDAEKWLDTVKYTSDTKILDLQVPSQCQKILNEAAILEQPYPAQDIILDLAA